MQDQVSIVIVSYNTKDFLRACLASISDHYPGLLPRVTVVDNASEDGTAEAIRAEFPEARLILNSSNLGYAKAVNQGIQASDTPYALVLNPDIEVSAGSIESMVKFMEDNPDAGITGARLVYPDGTLQPSCRTFYTLPVVLLRRTFLGKVFPNARAVREHLMSDWDHRTNRAVDWVIGASMMVRKEAFEKVGGMDERFFLYLEDVDWCSRMQKHGYRVYYVAHAEMKHHHRRESAKLLPDRKFMAHLFSTFRYYDKWGSGAYALKRERWLLWLLVTLVTDFVMINASFLIAYYIRYVLRDMFEKPIYPVATYAGFMIFVNLICIFSFVYSGLYRKPRRVSFAHDLIRVSRSILLSSLIIMAATYLTRTIAYSRFVVAIFWPVSALLVTFGRSLVRAVHRGIRRSFFDRKRIALVGGLPGTAELKDNLLRNAPGEYDFVGYILPTGHPVEADLVPVIGETADIGETVVAQRLREVFVSDNRLSREEVGKVILRARRFGVEVMVASEITDMLIHGSSIEEIGNEPFVVFPPSSLSGARLMTKGLLDWLAALAVFVLVLVISPLVLLFQAVTFRNFGSLVDTLRKLTYVIGGRNSLVGPSRAVGGERVKPGVTGLWLIGDGQESSSRTDRLDMYYLENWSLSFDMEIGLTSLGKLGRLFGSAGGAVVEKAGSE
jgi:GT2 family glycosyltransferase/lipopolysaccharide/colanic/teichoic acid biosynthesis glycosyltransferase